MHQDWLMENSAGVPSQPITAKIALDFKANAKFWSFFIPFEADYSAYVAVIADSQELVRCDLFPQGCGPVVSTGNHYHSEISTSAQLVFTKRAFLYIDANLAPGVQKQLEEVGTQRGILFIVRDRGYALTKSELEIPRAFISHDSRDKDALVRELAFELSNLMCPVWYDEYSLKVGDSLRTSIECGLKEATRCIVVLSPNFLSNEGWGRAEFDSIFTREILEKKNIILPIWHDVGVNDVYQYCPRLADRVGLRSSLGIKELARILSEKLKP